MQLYYLLYMLPFIIYFEPLILDDPNCYTSCVSLIQTAVKPYRTAQFACSAAFNPLLPFRA